MRTRVSEIRETGRNAAGVRLIRLDEGDRLVTMAKVDAEEAPPEGAAPAGAGDVNGDPDTPAAGGAPEASNGDADGADDATAGDGSADAGA
jgi:DNA gyrase subunit A